MSSSEFCELWWSDGYVPRLTYYRPSGVESVAVREGAIWDDAWDVLRRIVDNLVQQGWQLVSAGLHSPGLLFQRQLL